MDDKECVRRALDAVRTYSGEEKPDFLARADALSPDLGRLSLEFVFGEVHARASLPVRDRLLLQLGAHAAMGADAQVRACVGVAIINGISRRELADALIHLLPYIGFPRVIAAFVATEDLIGGTRIAEDAAGSSESDQEEC